jgi:hypothetical protein
MEGHASHNLIFFNSIQFNPVCVLVVADEIADGSKRLEGNDVVVYPLNRKKAPLHSRDNPV